MTTCPKCGWEIGDAKRCDRCGFLVDLWTAPAHASPRPATSTQHAKEMTWTEAFGEACRILIRGAAYLVPKGLRDLSSEIFETAKKRWWGIPVLGLSIWMLGSVILMLIILSSQPKSLISDPGTVGGERRAIVEHFTQYLKLLRSMDPDKSLFVSISPGSFRADDVRITVTNAWHVQPYQVRLQTAQNLWEAWAVISKPISPDNARISIVDYNGNEVGGSRILGGSLIWVSET